MRHLSDGLLRRLYDEPLTVPSGARQHFSDCGSCRSRYSSIAADAASARLWLDSTMQATRPDPATALAQVRGRIAGGASSRGETRTYRARPGTRRSVAGALLAAALAALVLTPAGSLAQSFLSIFQPQQFAAVPISAEDLRSLRQLPNLSAYGTMRGLGRISSHAAANPAEVAARTGLSVALPSTLPVEVPASVSYTIVPRSSASFTFSAARARTAAATGHGPLPPMPARLDGSSLTGSIGPIVVATYGSTLGLRIPSLVIAQGVAPRIEARGATVAEIEEYLLRQPGISPSLAAEIRAIGDPTTTVPIPVPISLASAHAVSVQGVRGLAIGDNTGVGSGVIWQKGGMVYGVAGALPESQILAIADGLH